MIKELSKNNLNPGRILLTIFHQNRVKEDKLRKEDSKKTVEIIISL